MGPARGGYPGGDGRIAPVATAGDRTRLLRRAHPGRDRRATRGATRNGEDTNPAGSAEAARPPRRRRSAAMTVEQDSFRESSGLYVLDALDAADRQAFEAHLLECAACTAEVLGLSAVSPALP